MRCEINGHRGYGYYGEGAESSAIVFGDRGEQPYDRGWKMAKPSEYAGAFVSFALFFEASMTSEVLEHTSPSQVRRPAYLPHQVKGSSRCDVIVLEGQTK